MYSSYSPDDEITSISDNDIDNVLGIGAVAAGAAGLGVAGEIQRRKSGMGGSSGQAATELKDDLDTAIDVILGRTPHDKIESAISVGEGFANLGTHRSIRDFATDPDMDPASFYNANKKAGYNNNPLTQAAVAARDAFNPSAEDFLSLKRQWRQEQGFSAEGPRTDTVISRIPSVD